MPSLYRHEQSSPVANLCGGAALEVAADEDEGAAPRVAGRPEAGEARGAGGVAEGARAADEEVEAAGGAGAACAPRYSRVSEMRSSSSLLSVWSSVLLGSLTRPSLICESWYCRRWCAVEWARGEMRDRVERGRGR